MRLILLLICATAWAQYIPPAGGGGGTPGGSDTQVQFNDGGVFGGNSGLTFDKTTGTVSIGATALDPIGENFSYITNPAALIAALAGAGAGNVDNGSHSYAVACHFANGTQTSPSSSVSVTVADKTMNGKVNLTNIPTCSGADSRIIFRSPADSIQLANLHTIADNVTTSYVDNIADASLGVSALMSNTTAGNLFVNSAGAFGIASQGETCCGPQFYAISNGDPNTGWISIALIDPTIPAGGRNAFAQLAEFNIGDGGFFFQGSSASINSSAFIFDGQVVSTNPNVPVFRFMANPILGNGVLNANFDDGAPLFVFDVDYARDGGRPTLTIVSGGANFSGGFPADGVRVGINVNSPTAILEVANSATVADTGSKVVAKFEGRSNQTGDMLQLTASDGTTIKAKIDKDGNPTFDGLKCPAGQTAPITVNDTGALVKGACS